MLAEVNMIGTVVVLYNPTSEEIINLQTYLEYSDYLVIVNNSEVSYVNDIKSALGFSNKYHIDRKSVV